MGMPVNGLLQHCEHALDPAGRAELIECCPTMDLVAVANVDENVSVFRFNGQKAFGVVKGATSRRVRALEWKFDGRALAVGWDNGTVDVVSADTGAMLPHIRQAASSASGDAAVMAIGWQSVRIDRPLPVPSLWSRAAADSDDTATPSTSPPDLPTFLAMLDADPPLPKLPTMPNITGPTGSASHAELFAHQASVDMLFAPDRPGQMDRVDVLTVHHQTRSAARVVLADLLSIGDLSFPPDWTDDRFGPLTGLSRASHPHSHSHVLLPLFDRPEQADSGLAFAPLTLGFVPTAGELLAKTTGRVGRVQNLLHYIHRAVDTCSFIWSSAEELPTRFISSATESLAASQSGSFVTALYHHAMTGNCPAGLKEWLVEQLAERGHKRWDHAVDQGYNRIFDIIHQCLLPAIDRLCMLLSSLRGLATHFSDNPVLQVPIDEFTAVLELIRPVRLVAHAVVLAIVTERDQFRIFSRWLRAEIERQSTSALRDDLEQDADVDFGQLLAYLNGPLVQSKLSVLLAVSTDTPPAIPYHKLEEQYREFCQLEDDDLAVSDEQSNPTKPTINLSIWPHFDRLFQACEQLGHKLTSLHLEKTTMPLTLAVETEGKVWMVDCRMVECGSRPSTDEDGNLIERENDGLMATYIACVKEDEKDKVHLHRIEHATAIHSLDDVPFCQAFVLQLPDAQIVDLKYVDDEELLLLIKRTDKETKRQTHSIISLDYSFEPFHPLDPPSDEFQKSNPVACASHYEIRAEREGYDPYTLFPSGNADMYMCDRTIWTLTDSECVSVTKHTFESSLETDEDEDVFVPFRIKVNGRTGRRFVCVVNKCGSRYRILDLDQRQSDLDGPDKGKDTVNPGGSDVVMAG